MKYIFFSVLLLIVSCAEVSRNSQIELGKSLFENESLYKTNADLKNLACVTCHPMGNMNNSAVDNVVEAGLTRQWNTPSLWNVDKTAPYLWGGEHSDLTVLTNALMTSFMKTPPSTEEVNAMVAYISSIPSPISPFLNTDGSMTESQKRGKILFDGRANCVRCHGGNWFTDNKRWLVDATNNVWIETPSLNGMWDTAPYWHNGNMKTIQDVFTNHKWIKQDSIVINFTASEKLDLEAYLNSL